MVSEVSSGSFYSEIPEEEETIGERALREYLERKAQEDPEEIERVQALVNEAIRNSTPSETLEENIQRANNFLKEHDIEVVYTGGIWHCVKKVGKTAKEHAVEVAAVTVAVAMVATAVIAAHAKSQQMSAYESGGPFPTSNRPHPDHPGSYLPPCPHHQPDIPIRNSNTEPVTVQEEVPTQNALPPPEEKPPSLDQPSSETISHEEEVPPLGYEEILPSPESENESGLRLMTAHLSHEIIDSAREFVAEDLLLPLGEELTREIHEAAEALLPDSIYDGIFQPKNSKEAFEGIASTLHEKVDAFFETNLAQNYTPEFRDELKDKFTLGIMPFPGKIPGIFNRPTALIDSGKIPDRGGLCKSGRSLMKHGYREGNAYGKPIGNPSQINEQGQKLLASIVTHPERTVTPKYNSRLGDVVEIYAPNTGVARFNLAGEFMGFLEP